MKILNSKKIKLVSLFLLLAINTISFAGPLGDGGEFELGSSDAESFFNTKKTLTKQQTAARNLVATFCGFLILAGLLIQFVPGLNEYGMKLFICGFIFLALFGVLWEQAWFWAIVNRVLCIVFKKNIE